MSSESIDREVSTTRTTVAFSTGATRFTCGRANATQSRPRTASSSPPTAHSRRLERCPLTPRSTSTFVNRTG
jgi:hypothetical protein